MTIIYRGELWQCNVCGEQFYEDGSGMCLFCGSDDVEEAEEEEGDE